MKIIKYKDFKNNEQGSIVVIVALLMTVLIGMTAFALDIGIAYNNKSKLQAALDSSVLAAVRELPLKPQNKNKWSIEWNKVIDKAKEYAAYNGVENPDELVFYAIDKDKNIITINQDNYNTVEGLQVIGNDTVSYNFAGILDQFTGIISCASTAKLVDIDGMSGLMPFSIDKDEIDNIKSAPDTNIQIKYQQNKMFGESGWFGAVQLDGSGADPYREAIINGCTTEYYIGNKLYIEEGNMVGPTAVGIESRFTSHETCTETNCINPDAVDGSCARKVVIPIVKTVYKSGADSLSGNDKIDYLEITGFASVFLVGFQELKYDELGNLIEVTDESEDKKDHIYALTVSYVETLNVTGRIGAGGVILNAYNVKAVKLID